MNKSVRLTAEQASEVLRAAAADAGGTVHQLCFTMRGEIMTSRMQIKDILDELQHAKLIAFEPGPFGHDLAVLAWGLIYRYDVPYPEAATTATHAKAILEQYGGDVVDALRRDAQRWREPADGGRPFENDAERSEEAAGAITAWIES